MRRGEAAKPVRPIAIAAEFAAPAHQPAREGVQRIILGEADGAVDLMGDGNGATDGDIGA